MADNIAVRTIKYNGIENLSDAPDGKIWSLSSSTNEPLSTLNVGGGIVTLNNNTLTISEVNAGTTINLYYYTPPSDDSSAGSTEAAADFIVEAADIIVSVENYTYGGNPIYSATFDNGTVNGTWKASSDSTSAIDWATLSAEEHTAIFIPDSSNFNSATTTFTVSPKTITESDIEYSGGNYPTTISANFKDGVTGTIEIKAEEGNYATFSNEIRPAGKYKLKFTGNGNYSSYIEKDVTINKGTITVGFDSRAKCLDVKQFTINLDLQYVNISISPESIATVSEDMITFGTTEGTALITFSAENYNEKILTIPVEKRNFTAEECPIFDEYINYTSSQSYNILENVGSEVSFEVLSHSESLQVIDDTLLATGYGFAEIKFSKDGYNENTINIIFSQRKLFFELNNEYFAGEEVSLVLKYNLIDGKTGIASSNFTEIDNLGITASGNTENFNLNGKKISFKDIESNNTEIVISAENYISYSCSTTIKKHIMHSSFQVGKSLAATSPFEIIAYDSDNNQLSVNWTTENCNATPELGEKSLISTELSSGTAKVTLTKEFYSPFVISIPIKSAIDDVDERLEIIEAWKESMGNSPVNSRIDAIENWIKAMQKYFVMPESENSKKIN